MAESTSLLQYEEEEEEEEEYRIGKRSDGTEDFHCNMASCAGVFSYRTLRALNNHRASSHSLPDIPKRKRGPKKRESSRVRCRSADAIKRQVMKRAMDISKREQGCRSMARLRASRLAMARAGEQLDTQHIRVAQEVGKSLEIWEGAALRRRSLLERRVQMARMEWAMKGETLPSAEADTLKFRASDDKSCCHVHGSEDLETIKGLPAMLLKDALGKGKESAHSSQVETGFPKEADPNIDDFAEVAVVCPSEIIDMDGNLCKMKVNINGEKGGAKNVIPNDHFDANHVWDSVKKFISVNRHDFKSLNERSLAQQADGFVPCFGRNIVLLEYCDTRQF